jgi:hypothetical protein
MARSRVELFEQIRRDWRAGVSSIRELAGRHHVHRRTVRQALAGAVPPPRKAYPARPRPAIGPYAAVIGGGPGRVPRKQRHTARRIWQRLVAEHGASVAEVTVTRYVACRRAELGLDKTEVMVPQAHAPGAEAEVDFGEFHAMIAGVLLKLWMFVMRLSCSGRAFHVAFATQAQEAFLEGHVLAFEYFGAVPGRVRYDNLGLPSCGHGSATLDEHYCYFCRSDRVLTGGHRDPRSSGITDSPVTTMRSRIVTGEIVPPCDIRPIRGGCTVMIGKVCGGAYPAVMQGLPASKGRRVPGGLTRLVPGTGEMLPRG